MLLRRLDTTVISPPELEQQRSEVTAPQLLDVRTPNEHAAGTIPGAQPLSAGKVLFHQADLPSREAGPIVSFCQSGLRNTVAASTLRRAGFDVTELEGSYAGWPQRSAQLPEQPATTSDGRSA